VIRAELVTAARKRFAMRFGPMPDLAHTVLIGDTPLDVDAARASGARIVAVATGKSTHDELTAAGADVVLYGLADTSAVIEAIDEASARPRNMQA